ncbi:hypothetical protein SCYAM73S_05002 [Streptomyces cyaneofuscatus]
MTAVFIGATDFSVSWPSGTVQVKLAGSSSRAPGLTEAASPWPLVSHQSSKRLLKPPAASSRSPPYRPSL